MFENSCCYIHSTEAVELTSVVFPRDNEALWDQLPALDWRFPLAGVTIKACPQGIAGINLKDVGQGNLWLVSTDNR